MTDGCAPISTELMRAAAAAAGWEVADAGGEPPAAVQGRLGGAKGVWLHCPGARGLCVRPSMVKFECASGGPLGADAGHATLEVVVGVRGGVASVRLTRLRTGVSRERARPRRARPRGAVAAGMRGISVLPACARAIRLVHIRMRAPFASCMTRAQAIALMETRGVPCVALLALHEGSQLCFPCVCHVRCLLIPGWPQRRSRRLAAGRRRTLRRSLRCAGVTRRCLTR